jgi:hypothetical protein
LRFYLALVGSILLVGAGWLFARRIALVLHGVTTTGRIESFEARNMDDSEFYLPVVTFRDHAGTLHRFTAVAGTASKSPPVGTRVVVRYLRANPESAFIASFLHMWGAPLGLAGLGIGSVAAFWLW